MAQYIENAKEGSRRDMSKQPRKDSKRKALTIASTG